MMVPPPPPLPWELLAGTQLRAGLGVSTVLADCDFETYSEAGFLWNGAKWVKPPGAPPSSKPGLPLVGAANYAMHPSTEVLSFYYDLKDGGGARFWKPGMPLPADLFAYVAAGGLVEAHNSGFEHWIWNHVCVQRYGWPRIPQEQFRCSAAKARAHALPGKLAMLSDVLDLQFKKDPEGDRLLKKFSMPRNPTKKNPRLRIRPDDDRVDGPHLYAYNHRDIQAEAEVSTRVPDLEGEELEHWLIDQRINYRGILLDMPAVHDCIAIVEQVRAVYGGEFERLVGCQYTEVQQLQTWLRGHGVHTESLDDDAVIALLKGDLDPAVRRALVLRSMLAMASIGKLYAMRLQADPEGRLHDLYTFHGARTGRPTGGGVQPTNLTKAGPDVVKCTCGHWHGAHTAVCPWCNAVGAPRKGDEWNPDAAEDAFTAVKARSLALQEAVFGPDPLLTISGMLRGMFVAKPGCRFISSDFSAIEGVVIAAIAGEQWRLDVFAGHGKIYEMSAAKILGIPFEEMMEYRRVHGKHHPARQNPGKIAELGLGFGGWINAWKQFNGPGTDDEIKDNIIAWRAASPAIVYLWGGQRMRPEMAAERAKARGWPTPPADDRRGVPELYGLEGTFIKAVMYPGEWHEVERLDGKLTGIAYRKEGKAVYCRLPSGRYITYHNVVMSDTGTWRGQSLSFEGYNTNPKNGPIGWIRINTYAGRLAENVVQAVARDIQMHAIRACENNGYPIVMHTYDEVVAEVPHGCGSVEHLEQLMADLPTWAKGWPIKAAGGWERNRYCKA